MGSGGRRLLGVPGDREKTEIKKLEPLGGFVSPLLLRVFLCTFPHAAAAVVRRGMSGESLADWRLDQNHHCAG